MRQTNGLSIVKPTAMFETKGPWVSMVLLGVPSDYDGITISRRIRLWS